jgi:hypothetical protein
VITRARTLSINCRNKTAMADIPFPSRHWNRRLPALIKFINNCAPSVIGVQETRDDMAVDITNGLGPNWTFWGLARPRSFGIRRNGSLLTIMLTDSTAFPIFASDHNGVFAKIEFSSPPGLPPL